jgi:hypothetical protein
MTDCANILKITFICALKATTHTKPSLDANDLIQWKKGRCSNISFPTKSITIDLVQL